MYKEKYTQWRRILFQVFKADSTFKNQCNQPHAKTKEESTDHINEHRKSIWQNLTSIHA